MLTAIIDVIKLYNSRLTSNEKEYSQTLCHCAIMKGESTHLLVNSASAPSTDRSSTFSLPQWRNTCCLPLRHLCLPSKAAILILCWTAIVGVGYYAAVNFAALLITSNVHHYRRILIHDVIILYATLALVLIFYPLSGFIADVFCGRLKMVKSSVVVLLISFVLIAIALVVMKTMKYHSFTHDQGILVIILACLSLFLFIIGLVGYQANIILLGLDQLFEAPSQYLSLFIHYATWIFHSGALPWVTIIPQLICINLKHSIKSVLYALTAPILLVFIVLLLISHCKPVRRWFHSQPEQHNPYKTVYNVLKFAKNHKHPLQRSAFTYSDNFLPSRLDFAKERYGGPFTTEQVENVKTFFRILLTLSALGPVFALEVPASVFVFPLFSIHILKFHQIDYKICDSELLWDIHMGSGSLMTIISVLFLFPGYIWIIFSLLRKKIPKLFTRLGIGVVLCLFGVVSLLVIDTVGHAVNQASPSNYTRCLFQAVPSSPINPNLDMHWAVLIPPNLLLGIGPLLVIATTLEFISAQSPQSMKGLLVGVFFAIRGLFQFLNSISILPLSLKQPWANEEVIEHPPVTNCGFVYLALTSVTGFIGLILFSLAAKRYKYRTRDEGIFRQQDVEEIYDRYITQDQTGSFTSD